MSTIKYRVKYVVGDKLAKAIVKRFLADAKKKTSYSLVYSNRANKMFKFTTEPINVKNAKDIITKLSDLLAQEYLDYREGDKFLVTFTPIVKDLKVKVPLSKEGETNCFVKLIEDIVPEKDHQFLRTKYRAGCSEKALVALSKKYKIKLTVYDILGNIWLATEGSKIINSVHHNNHIETHIIKKPTEQVILPKDMFYATLRDQPTVMIFGELDDCVSYVVDDTIYKNADIVLLPGEPSSTELAIHETTVTQRVFNKIMADQLPYTGDFITPHNSFHFNIGIPEESTTAYDQSRSYSHYAESPYYKQYRLPYPPTHLYATKSKDCLNYTGFTQIDNVKCKFPFLKHTYYNKSVYPNVELKALLDKKLITFTVLATSWSVGNQHIDFNPVEFNGIPLPNLKLTQNSLIGKLAPKTSIKTIVTHNKNEHLHLRSALYPNVIRVNEKVSENNSQVAENNSQVAYYISYEDKTHVPKSYAHIREYILAYQRISLLDFIVDNYVNLSSVNVDCVYLNAPSVRQPYPHEFLKAPENKTPLHYKPEKKVIYTGTPSKMPELPLFTERVIFIRGLPGTGKSHVICNVTPMNGSCVSFPTNLLKSEMITDLPKYTTHSLFTINCNGNDSRTLHLDDINRYQQYNSYVIDECTMMNEKMLATVLKRTGFKTVICLYGDDQLPPIEGIPVDPNQFYCITNNEIKRQTEPEYKKLIADVFATKSLNKSIKLIEDVKPQITLDEVKSIFQPDDIILCGRNDDVDHMNSILLDENTTSETVPVIYKSRATKGKREHINRSTYDPAKHKLAYATTVHSVQGLSIKYNLFMYVDGIFDKRILNVALSRTRKLANFYLFDLDSKYKNRLEKLRASQIKNMVLEIDDVIDDVDEYTDDVEFTDDVGLI